ncbi:glycosyltransferase family 2 protein [Halodesulfovibrio spirochaetisodalis]|uniref:glycosyltransferase family 2 protein n=1 Tax=Halodesulfovibrio spirochaetisodalis TaxID=1560234 RepID=UPI00082C3A3D|nr:glycosyltransferase family 2 protein [Halodesulfovibrio spirochaetisodalis]
MSPLFTIITSTFNAAEAIPDLLESLANQTFRDFQWIVQDGLSTDGTVELARSYADRIPNMSIESAQDSGIYNAWNNALSRIEGQWVLFLGADDVFMHNDSLEQLAAFIVATQVDDVAYIASDVMLGSRMLLAEVPLTNRLKRQMTLPHQGLLHSSKLFTSTSFRDSYKIAGDYDFLVRTLSCGKVIKYPRVISRMGEGGISQQWKFKSRMHKEYVAIIHKHFGWRFSMGIPFAKLCVSTTLNCLQRLIPCR